jgi:hypothetical protein
MLKRELYARQSSGIFIDKNKINDDSEIVSKLARYRDNQVDIVICNSTLHSVSEAILG